MLNVLIVEDEAIIRHGMAEAIPWASMGCSVVGTAADGRDGLEMMRGLRPDIVISDIKMPIMDGLSMLRAAKDEGINTAAIILTSYAEFPLAQEAIRLGSFDYLLKPVDENLLRDAVARIQKKVSQGSYEDTKKLSGIDENIVLPAHQPISLIDWENLMTAARRKSTYVARALAEITESYSESASIEELSVKLGVSGSYLSRKFKEITGSTFGSLLAARRIEAATGLLSNERRIYEVAETVGFHDYKNFCLVFKKLLHTTPKEYIKSRSNEKDIT